MKPHPAKFSPQIIETIASMIEPLKQYEYKCILDPFAGIGGIFDLNKYHHHHIIGIEIEPEWANQHDGVFIGNALDLPYQGETFDFVITSPTYSNRLADSHNAKDDSKRHTYTHYLGRKLHSDNSGYMQWGGKYRTFHEKAWRECYRVLKPNGTLILNIKDHIRKGKKQMVPEWHTGFLISIGFDLVQYEKVPVRSLRHGRNYAQRIDHEIVAKFVKVNNDNQAYGLL